MDVATCPVEFLLAPLTDHPPVGFFDEENETYQTLEQEMIKLGGLHEAELDWSYVTEASAQYLAGQCKHFRVAAHWAMARWRERTWPAWADTVVLLAGMVERYWEIGHPKPGPTGYPGKRKQVATWVDRCTQALARLGPDSFAPEHRERAQAALDAMQQRASALQLDVPALTRLEAQLRKHAEHHMRPALADAALPGDIAGLKTSSLDASTLPPLNGGRESRRALQALAEAIHQHDPYDPTGYTLRRFALWAFLQTPPPAVREQRTELRPAPADRVARYHDALAQRRVDPALLQRVEQSVAASPYWLRGSFLAAAMADRLAMSEVSAAIRHATLRFVQRLPTLRDLQFDDGTPFIDAETEAWLIGENAMSGTANTPLSPEFGEMRRTLAAQMDEEGIEAVLRTLQSGQTANTPPRDRGHASIMAAELLAARGFTWLAEELCARVDAVMTSTTADQWEPQLHERVNAHRHAQAARPHSAKGKG